MSGLGITAGAHRLWAHRSYKAKLPLRIILMVFNTIAFEVNLKLVIIVMTKWFNQTRVKIATLPNT